MPIEPDIPPGASPGTIRVGLAEAAARESIHRIERALVNSGHHRPVDRIVINLSLTVPAQRMALNDTGHARCYDGAKPRFREVHPQARALGRILNGRSVRGAETGIRRVMWMRTPNRHYTRSRGGQKARVPLLAILGA